MHIDLSGKTALVTGGTGELGRVMVRTLAACGANVGIHTFSQPERAKALQAELSSMGRKSTIVQADITKQDGIDTIKSAMEADLGMPDIVVNNAVIQYQWTTLLEQSLADYIGQFESTVLHNVMMSKAFVPAMQAKGYGRVIIINTECTMQCFPTQSAYVAGKRGLDGIARILAKEIGSDGITVNQVAPGWIDSETRRDNDDEGSRAYKDKVPLKRRGSEQDIANAVAFLGSDLASFITGVYLPVAGGNVMPTV